MIKINRRVTMADTDAAGILYFANQLNFAHEAFEALIETAGFGFHNLMESEDFVFVIRQAESEYLAALHVGDKLVVTAWVSHIGTTSFKLSYELFKDDQLVGRAATVHVTLDKKTRQKIKLPEKLTRFLTNHCPTPK